MSTTPFDASAFCAKRVPVRREQLAAPAIKNGFESVVVLRGKDRHSRNNDFLVEESKEEQDGPVIAHFIADTYKTYHPAYAAPSGDGAPEEEAKAELSSPHPPGSPLRARLTPKKVHDDSYEGLLRAADFVDGASAVDQVVLVRRDNVVVYANEKEREGSRGATIRGSNPG
ncbi:hypothetical protein PG988_008916 [Apiospora saccharicola]